jgi:hypothetical protein
MRFHKLALCLLLSVVPDMTGVLGDLRAASQPRGGYNVRQREEVKFVTQKAIYIEPSDFKYQGLVNQRNGGGYDNFLRSNIDNEQDKRNFNNEAGKDMLPFRSYEGGATDQSSTIQTKIPDQNPGPGPVITATPGVPVLYPLRWNNPHASELEVNIWIMKSGSPNPVVVPIRLPTCSGEGHQDNVISFIVPSDFNELGSKIPGFKGCKAEGDCVLQVYAHSVEPRTYAIGVPLVVTGNVPTATATDLSGIQPAKQDVGLNLNQLTHEVCLPSTDPKADIPNAVPRAARLVSDVFNHAYQNSNYSPYSGQQPEAISTNLQAAGIISMIPANQGELGQAATPNNVKQFAAGLRNKVNALVQKYEGATNKIIAAIGDKVMKSTAKEGLNDVQNLAECFRCAEVGAVTRKRLTTSTYIPSFQLPKEQIDAAKKLIPQALQGLISPTGVVQIYQATLDDLKGEFAKAAKLGLQYQPAMLKSTLTTMADATDFKKRNAAGKTDGGVYAAQQVQQAKKQSAQSVSQQLTLGLETPMMKKLSSDEFQLDDYSADFGIYSTVEMVDVHGVNYDSACDDDTNPVDVCEPPQAMFAQSSEDGAGLEFGTENSNTQQTTSTSKLNVGIIVGIAAGAGILVLLITAAIVKHYKSKKQQQVTQTVTHAV